MESSRNNLKCMISNAIFPAGQSYQTGMAETLYEKLNMEAAPQSLCVSCDALHLNVFV